MVRAGAVVVALLAGEASAAGLPVECRMGALSDRFVEAARLCGQADERRGRAAADSQGRPVGQVTGVTVAPVLVDTREAVSVSMPGYRRRLASAVHEADARGGRGAAPTLVTAIAQRYRINPRLLASIVRTESAGRPGAISNKGALGLMQVMPGTARGMGVRDPNAMLTNPVLAMSTGAAYLKRLQGQFGNNVPVVMAAYNAGPGAVIKAGGRIPRYRETQGYVRSVVGGYTAPAK